MKNIGKHLQNSGFKTELSFAIDSSGKKEEKFYKTLWQHQHHNTALYQSIVDLPQILVASRFSKYPTHTFIKPGNFVFDSSVTVIARSSYGEFAVLESSLHAAWANRYASSRGRTLSYGPKDCLDNFPFPDNTDSIAQIGKAFYENRVSITELGSLGLVKVYNAFHDNSLTSADQAIPKLRELQVQMDNAVLAAYGWSDIELCHDFYEVDYLPENDRVRFTIHPDAGKNVLNRLLQLNH
jgi:hypothetical protein